MLESPAIIVCFQRTDTDPIPYRLGQQREYAYRKREFKRAKDLA